MEQTKKCFYCGKQVYLKKIKYIQVPYGNSYFTIQLCNNCANNNKNEALNKAWYEWGFNKEIIIK